MELLRKIQNKLIHKKITIDDLFFLNELLKTNLPIKSCFSLLKNKSNALIFDDILGKLKKGQMIENIIGEYLPQQIAGYMNNLLKRLSFSKSLELSLSFYNKNKENSKNLQKALAYPLVLLFVSLTAIYLFDNYGVDSILSLMKSLKADVRTFMIFRIILKIFVYVFYFGFIIVSILILYFANPKRITLFYILLCRYFPNSLVNTYFTEDFISLFVITLNLGYKTKDAIEILKSIKNKPLVSFLAFHLDEELLNGGTLKEASSQNYFDEVLAKFINIASYSNNFTGILNNYIEMAKQKIKNRMKLYTGILQAVSYFVVGLIVIFIYQVLFLPMQAINAI